MIVQGHPIRVAAQKTGLSPHLIRIWERRYNAVTPSRTESNRRLYTDKQIERLRLLRRATRAGENISQIAQLSHEELRQLVDSLELPSGVKLIAIGNKELEEKAERILADCLDAIERLDPIDLEGTLLDASVELSQPLLLERVLERLMHEIGDRWRQGNLRVVHEHMASAIVRSFLGSLAGASQAPTTAPKIVVTTPAGQMHEFGALIVTITAVSQGWRALYLGPSLPAEDIVAAQSRSGAEAVALSLVYPGDDPMLTRELRRLRKLLGDETPLLIGGRAAVNYANLLADIRAIVPRDLEEFSEFLARLRTEPNYYSKLS
jgi:DNA-binding transcriptional MerR regulator/methylmalonyl-CoA mutase cobalamin-binding subunit